MPDVRPAGLKPEGHRFKSCSRNQNIQLDQCPAREILWGIFIPPARVNNRSTKSTKLRKSLDCTSSARPRHLPPMTLPPYFSVEMPSYEIEAPLSPRPDAAVRQWHQASAHVEGGRSSLSISQILSRSTSKFFRSAAIGR